VPLRERRQVLEAQLLESGLGYGTGKQDPAIELDPEAGPGTRAFAHFVAGLLRLCVKAATLSHVRWFVPGAPKNAVDARRAQLLAVLTAAGGDGEAAARLFDNPLAVPSPLSKLADKTAARLARRYLAERGPFAGLPLHNGLCAIEVRACATLALSSFGHGRMSPAAAALVSQAALRWRAVLVELLAGLSSGQENGKVSLRGIDQVLRSQRLPVREARLLRGALHRPRRPGQLAPHLHSQPLRQFALTQVLLAALVDGRFEAGEVAYVEELAQTLGVDAAALAQLEVSVADFYRSNQAALAALRLAETPEGLPHAFTTRLEAAVADNLARILQEIRETGELAELLAKASVGGTLTAAEKSKVREQLIDLAKTIPALAIFAAPGGMILLPILLKLLPFNLLPSSFVDPPQNVPALPERRRRAGP
jgi:LETM1-like protein